MNDDRTWLVVGARVAALRLSSGGFDDDARHEIRFSEINDVTAREVVLADGQHFPLRTLERRSDGAWGPLTRLFPADHEAVKQVVWQRERHTRKVNARASAIRWLADVGDVRSLLVDVARLDGNGAVLRLLGVETDRDAVRHPNPGRPRDPERIDEVLAALAVHWKANPDLRLGQIIASAAATQGAAEHQMEDHAVLVHLTRSTRLARPASTPSSPATDSTERTS